MKFFVGSKISVFLIGFCAALLVGAGSAEADFTFGTPTNIGPPVNTSATDAGPSISADGLSLYFHSNRSGGSGVMDLWVAKRSTISDPWDTPVNLGPKVNSGTPNHSPSISADGLSLFFYPYSEHPGGAGGTDIWVTTQPTTDGPWSSPVNLGPSVNSSADDSTPDISADGLTLYFISFRPGGYGEADFWVTTRTTKNTEWGTPLHLGSTVNSSYAERQPTISTDGLALFFGSTRPGGSGSRDIWVSRRATTDDPWGEPVNLGPAVNSSAPDCHPDISGDGSTLYFVSTRPGGVGDVDIWQVPIIPIVDFNGDGIVDADDMCTMVDYWGTNEPFCDIGPMPWGDGIVDVEDLRVLAEHWFEDVKDPTLIAYWPLDETQGVVAYDNVTDCDGTLMGGPVWQPDGGMVDGALQFDGVDDCVGTDFVLNPADGVFSVVAWIKGGVPGQAVLSQAHGASWLCADSVKGCLMTELTNSGRSLVGPMLSQGNITDGNWHRIGLVWDGLYRSLYVDGAEVARDAAQLSDLESAESGLYIGVGSGLEPGTYWSGLIDDVRIYNRVVRP